LTIFDKKEIMKFKLFVIILFVLGYNSLSYSQCKFEINETDKFTGVSKLETKLEILHKDFNSAIAINFCKYNNDYFIRLGLNLSNQIYSISKGDKLMFICGDSTITLISNESKVVSGYTNIVYNLTESQIKILKSNTITDLRIYLINSYLDKVIDPKKAEKIKLAVGCI
jgi:hypothetical protein